MPKLKIKQTVTEGLVFLINNPIIFVLFSIPALLSVYTRNAMLTINGLPIYFLSGALNLFITATVIRYVYEVRAGKASFKEAAKTVLRVYLPLLLAFILSIGAVLLGYIFFVIPGAYLAIKFGFVIYSMIIDNNNVIGSFKKSWSITEGNWWRIFFLFLILFMPLFVFSYITIAMANSLTFTYLEPMIFFILTTFTLSLMTSSLSFAYIELKDSKGAPKTEQTDKKHKKWIDFVTAVVISIMFLALMILLVNTK